LVAVNFATTQILARILKEKKKKKERKKDVIPSLDRLSKLGFEDSWCKADNLHRLVIYGHFKLSPFILEVCQA
jgi:hypothetical protein